MRTLSFLTPEQVRDIGHLPGEAIVGVLGDGDSPDEFRANRVFIDLMHEVIRTAGPLDPDMLAAAQAQKEGWVYLIDFRTPDGPGGRVPSRDIIGAFQVRDGELVAGSYWANDNHLVYSADGLMRLPAFFHRALIERLLKSPRSSEM